MDLSKVSTDDILKELTDRGYAVGALWCIDDVQSIFKADKETALDILNDVLTKDHIVEDIFAHIRDLAESEGLEEIED